MTSPKDLPNDCIKEICGKDAKNSYITSWFLSQCCKGLRRLRPKSLPVEKFIKKLLISESLSLLEYYINTSMASNNFWIYFCNQDYFLAYLGNNLSWRYIQLLIPKLSPQQNSIVMEFGILRMSIEELKSYKAVSCGDTNLDGYRVISMRHRVVTLKYDKKWPITLDRSLYLPWCCRHSLVPLWMRGMHALYPTDFTISELSHYFRFGHNNLDNLLKELRKIYHDLDLKEITVHTINNLKFKYGYKWDAVMFSTTEYFTSKNLTYSLEYKFKTMINLQVAPFSKKHIDRLIERLKRGDEVIINTIKIIQDASFLPRYDEIIKLLETAVVNRTI